MKSLKRNEFSQSKQGKKDIQFRTAESHTVTVGEAMSKGSINELLAKGKCTSDEQFRTAESPIVMVGEAISQGPINELIVRQKSSQALEMGHYSVKFKLGTNQEIDMIVTPERTNVKIDGEEFLLFEGSIVINRILEIVHRDGSHTIAYEMRVNLPNETAIFQIEKKAYRHRMVKEIESQCTTFALNKCLPNSWAIFDMFLSRLAQRGNYEIKKYFDFSGWYRDDKNAGWIYLNGNMQNVKAKMHLPQTEVSGYQLGLTNLLAMVQNNPSLYIIFLFSHLGFTARLLQMAGIEPHFMLYLTGKTGSFKTSLLKTLSGGIFEDTPYTTREARFYDTLAAIDEKIKERRDSLLLIDDYHPAATRTQQASMRNNLEHVIRVYGDCEGRGKLGPDRKLIKNEKICGAAWMTGEVADFSTYSDILRVITINIDEKTVSQEALSALQDNIEALKVYYAGYIQEIGKLFLVDRKVIEIRKKKNRAELSQKLPLAARRYVDAALALNYINDLVWKAAEHFGVNNSQLMKAEGAKMLDEFFRELVAVTQMQKPAMIFGKAVKELFNNDKLNLASSKDLYYQGYGEGYMDEERLLLNTIYINDLFQKYCLERGLNIPRIERRDLIDAGIILPGIERTTKERKGGQRPKIYGFKKESILENENGGAGHEN